MIPKLNSLAKVVEELELSVRKDSVFYKSIVPFLEKKSDDALEIDDITEDKIEETLNLLNEIKRKNFHLKILEVGKNANSLIELNEAKSQGIESIIEIPEEIKLEVNKYKEKIISEQLFLKTLKDKDHETVVEEYKLLPKSNIATKLGFSSIIMLISCIIVFLGYIAYFDQKLFSPDFGYWSMLGGSIVFIVMAYLFIMWLVQYLNFQKNKKDIIRDLSQKLVLAMEKKYIELETKLKNKIFEIEKKVFSDASKISIISIVEEKKDVLKSLSKHFYWFKLFNIKIQIDVEKIVSGVQIKTAPAEISLELLYIEENKKAFIPGAIAAVITALRIYSILRLKTFEDRNNVIKGCNNKDKIVIINILENWLYILYLIKTPPSANNANGIAALEIISKPFSKESLILIWRKLNKKPNIIPIVRLFEKISLKIFFVTSLLVLFSCLKISIKVMPKI